MGDSRRGLRAGSARWNPTTGGEYLANLSVTFVAFCKDQLPFLAVSLQESRRSLVDQISSGDRVGSRSRRLFPRNRAASALRLQFEWIRLRVNSPAFCVPAAGLNRLDSRAIVPPRPARPDPDAPHGVSSNGSAWSPRRRQFRRRAADQPRVSWRCLMCDLWKDTTRQSVPEGRLRGRGSLRSGVVGRGTPPMQ